MLPEDNLTHSFPNPVVLTKAMFRSLINIQVNWSQTLDRLLPEEFQVDGNRHFIDCLVPEYAVTDSIVYDVGGGKNPVIDWTTKTTRRLKVIGLDIDAEQLALAPDGLYDSTIQADITSYDGTGDADVVICQALLEHVRNTERAMAGIAGILRPGGRALIFVPSANAVFARLNRILPQRVKRCLLHTLYPRTRRDQGFRAYYDRCTPNEMDALANRYGLVRETGRLYFRSDYFQFFAPLHVLWRLWLILFRWFAGAQAAETFSVVYFKGI